ncbi:hypothetical protein E2C01_034828 [Portunus trituberculatus]|uniref:Uncharacterized protein n=1 Tax=Portunus trituberculatus TaxID=210409 RepID=A0A5B7F3V9_PORTR|nr:hypothetical protein [Portunus trituberculatus]
MECSLENGKLGVMGKDARRLDSGGSGVRGLEASGVEVPRMWRGRWCQERPHPALGHSRYCETTLFQLSTHHTTTPLYHHTLLPSFTENESLHRLRGKQDNQPRLEGGVGGEEPSALLSCLYHWKLVDRLNKQPSKDLRILSPTKIQWRPNYRSLNTCPRPPRPTDFTRIMFIV